MLLYMIEFIRRVYIDKQKKICIICIKRCASTTLLKILKRNENFKVLKRSYFKNFLKNENNIKEYKFYIVSRDPIERLVSAFTLFGLKKYLNILDINDSLENISDEHFNIALNTFIIDLKNNNFSKDINWFKKHNCNWKPYLYPLTRKNIDLNIYDIKSIKNLFEDNSLTFINFHRKCSKKFNVNINKENLKFLKNEYFKKEYTIYNTLIK